MNAIISRGDKTAHVQLPVERKQLAGALSYLGANHTSDYDLKYAAFELLDQEVVGMQTDIFDDSLIRMKTGGYEEPDFEMTM